MLMVLYMWFIWCMYICIMFIFFNLFNNCFCKKCVWYFYRKVCLMFFWFLGMKSYYENFYKSDDEIIEESNVIINIIYGDMVSKSLKSGVVCLNFKENVFDLLEEDLFVMIKEIWIEEEMEVVSLMSMSFEDKKCYKKFFYFILYGKDGNL